MIAAVACLGARAQTLTFEQAFSAKGEPASLHYRAVYGSGAGAQHRLEVWRDGDRRVKRVTDQTIQTYAFHQAGGPEFRMSVLDVKRRILTRINRTNLYRIGAFADWFDLGHGLKHPKGAYRLSSVSAPSFASRPLRPCKWYSLKQGARSSSICWDTADGLPMLILTDAGTVVWQVAAVDRGPISPKVFKIHDVGYVINDANTDIERD